jgi:5-methylcytosine-specific restriction endonuclease McrA
LIVAKGVPELAAGDTAPLIKVGSSGGATAGKAFPQAVKDAAFAENPGLVCVYCRLAGNGSQVDHVIARSRRWNATIENAQVTCDWCNPSKGVGVAPKNPPPQYEGPWPPPWWPKRIR